eukprot:CAMPEP_0197848676 /NCGR_PEP_ID=MMETSP1438-20131217/9579_1 /TAXON_ID=1461541 /ORGANISM="Pterosperma sp., Strain CCMP1384" /LENGTH=307 /DNA_ID=CAMNT_0043461037 /DNA_START=510 /DNA_END=1433 /DNA_ORIENTATION=+
MGKKRQEEIVEYGQDEESELDVSDDSDDSDTIGTQTSDEEDTSWIMWFCALKGNELFCEVEESYIDDDFNLQGLAAHAPGPYYEEALKLILDEENVNDHMLTEEQHEEIETYAEQLYGMIHARYILTTRGLEAMRAKFNAEKCHFGTCPRVYCGGQRCLPMGVSDTVRTAMVQLYCPKCRDTYSPTRSRQKCIDGAYFGTTFPHLFLMHFDGKYDKNNKPLVEIPTPDDRPYEPKVFGFKVHPSARSGSNRSIRTIQREREEKAEQAKRQRAIEASKSKEANKAAAAGDADRREGGERKDKQQAQPL